MQVLKEEIRKKIIETAEELFFQKGYKETTTRTIADKVGISVSNLYLYYHNKEAVFNDVVEGFYRYFCNSFETFLIHQDSDIQKDADVSHLLKNIILSEQKKFVIIADKSQGTKYEGFLDQVVRQLTNHISDQMQGNNDDFILNLLVKNFMNGVIVIAKNYKDEAWLEENLQILVNYHLNGMKYIM